MVAYDRNHKCLNSNNLIVVYGVLAAMDRNNSSGRAMTAFFSIRNPGRITVFKM